MTSTIASIDELRSWAAGADHPYSPLAEPVLLLDAASDGLDASMQSWLRELPCPSVAIAPGDNALSRACDLRLARAEEAAALATAIRQRPRASAILVQLLRLQEGLPLESALQAESLAYATLQAGAEYQAWLHQHRHPQVAAHHDEGPAVLMERHDDVLELELNRPSLRNSMSIEMRDALIEALQLVLADDSIGSVRIRGRGKCFSVGGELSEFGTASDPATAHLIRSLALPGRVLARCAPRAEVRLHGACIGSGIEFPAFAARLLAQRNAWFQLPELQFGLLPGAGGTVSIARRIGRQRLAWLALSGKRIDADTALAWGLVDALVS